MKWLKPSHSEAMSGRGLKQTVLNLLKADAFDESIRELCMLPARQVINPLFSFLVHTDEKLRWRAITAMGAVVENLAREDMEGARVIMRRLMWSLNEESGGIGWGAPEALAEIMAWHEGLAREFSHILISYMDYEGNFLEYDGLQRGVLWGLVRLARVRPQMVAEAAGHLEKYLKSGNATVRGFAAWASGLLGVQETRPALQLLMEDDSLLRLYIDNKFTQMRVQDLAEKALTLLERGRH
ncbi:MAG: DVU0298 family protein [Desulfomonilaceae bacterium]